jgi:Lrp/AsnC family transcriptional regulator of ectoine degradation
MRLDDRDLKILAILAREGRITNQRLAERVSLSPSACLDRVRRLEAGGVVTGYRAEVAVAKVARSVQVFVQVTLKRHEAADFTRFEQAVRAVPEILDCHAIGGGIDYLLRVVAADVAHYQEIVERLLAAEIGIGTYFTYIVTKPIKENAAVPFERLMGRGS